MRVLALASYDSFLNVARLIAPYFEAEGCSVDYALVHARAGEQISKSQLKAFDLGQEARWVRLENLCGSGQISEYDIVLSCLEGVSTRRLFHCLEPLGANRPLVISIYAGLVLRYANDGYSVRQRSDLFWLNCQADFDAYTAMCDAFGVDSGNARVFGCASLLHKIERSPDAANGPVVFFEQTVIPRYHQERVFLAEQLVGLAKRFPHTPFAIKPRVRSNEATLHRTWHPIEPLMREAAKACGGWPQNLEIVSDKASDLLQNASHCLTVCSTVAAEAIHANVPTAIIGDFGAHDDYGMQYFYGSGLIRNFVNLDFPFCFKPSEEWLARYLVDTCTQTPDLIREAMYMARLPRESVTTRPAHTEMSSELRRHVLRNHTEDILITRVYQRKPNRSGWIGRFLKNLNNHKFNIDKFRWRIS